MVTNNNGSAFKYQEAIDRYNGAIDFRCMDYLFNYENASTMDIKIMMDDAIDLYNSIKCIDGEFKTLAMTNDGAIHVMIRSIYEIPLLLEMNAIIFRYFGGIRKHIAINQSMNMIIDEMEKSDYDHN